MWIKVDPEMYLIDGEKAMPRIITVDPTGTIARIVRSAMDLLDLSIIQVDVPSGADALEELSRPANLVVSAFELDDNMKGFEFALRVKRVSQSTSVLILGDVDDPDDLDEETTMESPFVYMSRPVDIHVFLRVLMAGMESNEAMTQARHQPVTSVATAMSSPNGMGPVPTLDTKAAVKIIEPLARELGTLAILFASRDGDVVVEHGTTNTIDRNNLTRALVPVMQTNIGVRDVIGGQVSTVQLYDGDDYDIFVLSVGLHHFLCILFDGQKGGRQFGMVNRYGRQAVEDLIALLGANAFFIQPPAVEEKTEPAKRSRVIKKQAEEEEPLVLERASIDVFPHPEEAPEPVIQQLDPIENLNVDALFSNNFTVSDDMFDIENLEKLAKENQQGGKKLGLKEAEELGLI